MSLEDLKKQVLKIELVAVDKIKANPANPRRITQKQFDELCKSVENFWQMLYLRPVILDEDGMVLGGNRRYLAAKKAGFKYVPCIYAKNLSIQQRAEFIIKDNTTAGEWDMNLLAENWDNKLLSDWGYKAPDLTPKEPGVKEVSFKAKEKPPCFDIILKADSDLARQQMINRLSAAGFVQDTDYSLA